MLLSQSLGQIAFAIVGPVALAVTSAGALAGNTVTARWFQRHRGRALGILAVSTSAGGFLMTPLFAALIDNYGWRDALDIVSIAIPLLRGSGKHIVFIANDHEYRSEETNPAIAKILAKLGRKVGVEVGHNRL